MTKKQAAAPLGKQEGRIITGTSIVVTNTGDGLSKAVEVEPKIIKQGETGYIVIEFECYQVSFPAEDSKHPGVGGVKRVHHLRAGTATFIDDAIVKNAIAEQYEKNMRHESEARGQHELADTELTEAHERGEHAKALDEHCPACRHEMDLAAQEAGDAKKPASTKAASNGLEVLPGGKSG